MFLGVSILAWRRVLLNICGTLLRHGLNSLRLLNFSDYCLRLLFFRIGVGLRHPLLDSVFENFAFFRRLLHRFFAFEVLFVFLLEHLT